MMLVLRFCIVDIFLYCHGILLLEEILLLRAPVNLSINVICLTT